MESKFVQVGVHLLLFLVQILFASLAIIGKIVLRDFPPASIVLFRVVGAAIVLMLANLVWNRRWVRDRRDLLRLAVLGLLGVLLNQTLFLLGLSRTTAINATILVTTIPIFTVLYSVLSKREPASALKLAGIGVAACGALYLIGPDRWSTAPDLALGNLLIVLAMVFYALYLVHSKAMVMRYGPVTVSAYVMLFSAFGTLPLGISGLASVDLGAVRGVTWAWVAYIVVFPTILAYFLNIWALRRVSANLVAAYIYLQPIFTALVAPAVLSGERVTLRAAIAGATIFVGLALVILGEERQRREVPVESLPGE
jgi:drug/metabolite transporter (DMT)-like permease